MKRSILIGIVLLIVPALILAQPAGKSQGEPCGQMEMQAGMNCPPMGAMPGMNMLKLTDQQKAEHKKINLKYQRLNIPLRSDLKLANLDLKEAMENLDQKKIDEAVKKINDINAKLFKNKIDQKIEFMKTLTEEQKKILKDRPCGMHKMRKVQMMKDCGDMGLLDTEIDVSFGFGADLPTDIDTDDIELDAEPED